MRKMVLLLVCVLGCLLPLTAQPVDVYLLAGQSNMQGIAKLENAPEDFLGPIPGVYFWGGGEFIPLVAGETQTSNRAGEFGPELGFAKTIAAAHPERKVYIVKFARSGQPLHHGWDGNKWVGGEPAPGRRNFYPGEAIDDPNIGTHYRDMCQTFQSALSKSKSQGVEYRVAGFAWMQGEQDSKDETSAQAYGQSLNRLHRRLIKDFGLSRLPFVFGQVLPHMPALPRFTHRADVRQAMADADSRSGRPSAIQDVYMVSTDGYTVLPDTVHFDAEAQIRLGTAFAREILDASR